MPEITENKRFNNHFNQFAAKTISQRQETRLLLVTSEAWRRNKSIRFPRVLLIESQTLILECENPLELPLVESAWEQNPQNPKLIIAVIFEIFRKASHKRAAFLYLCFIARSLINLYRERNFSCISSLRRVLITFEKGKFSYNEVHFEMKLTISMKDQRKL